MLHRAPLLFAAVVALMACGNSAPEPTTTSTQPSAAQAHPEASPRLAAPTDAAAPPPESARCLDLVGKARFEEALPVCVRAAGLDPENTAVKEALETARAKTTAAAIGSRPDVPSAGKDMAAGAVGGELP